MATNIEIKARAANLAALRARVAALAEGPDTAIEQRDVFFHTRRGRLKLRFLGPDRGELIAYERSDTAGPRTSDYTVVATDHPKALGEILERHLGVRGEVRKRRRLFMVGQTRVHLDVVEGLGEFVELEVVLRPNQPAADGHAIARELMRAFGIGDGDLVPQAYIDLLEQRRTAGGG